MSLLERLRRLIASNVNALIESLQDPGAAIDELIANMEAAAREARGQVKAALAEEIRTARLRDTTDKSVAEWAARAERAVRAGDDDLAAEALARRAELSEQLAAIDAERVRSKEEVDALTHGLRELEGKITVVKARKETLKSVMRARKRGGGAVERYDRLVTDVDVREAEVQLGEDLGDTETTESTRAVRARIDKLEADRAVDDRLAALKEKLNKK